MNHFWETKVRSNLFDVTFLLRHYSALSYVILSFGVLIHSYFQLAYSETISFILKDGLCDTTTQGIGVHCFGDFYGPISVAANYNPWAESNLAYSPVNFFYFKVVSSDLLIALDARMPLFLNFLLTIASLAIPSIHMMKSSNQSLRSLGKWGMIASLTSGPSLIILDRGNSSFLIFPLLYFFFIGLTERNFKLSIGMLIAMTLWRPQALFFVLGILSVFGLKAFMKAGVLSVVTLGVSFTLYPKSFPTNLIVWFQNSREFQNYVPIPWPNNFTFVNFAGLLDGVFKFVVNPAIGVHGIFRPGLTPEFVSFFCLLFTLFVVVLLVVCKNKIAPSEVVFFLTVFFILLPGVTFGYYLILLLLPMFIFGRLRCIQTNSAIFNKSTWLMYILLLLLALPPWPLSWKLVGVEAHPVWDNYGINWTFVHIQISVIGIYLIYRLIKIILRSRLLANNT